MSSQNFYRRAYESDRKQTHEASCFFVIIQICDFRVLLSDFLRSYLPFLLIIFNFIYSSIKTVMSLVYTRTKFFISLNTYANVKLSNCPRLAY